MLKEKQMDELGWRDRLNDLDNLDGEAPFNKDQSWDALQNSLQEKPRRTKMIWYWAAAACLLPLLWWAAVTVNKKDTIIVKTDAQPKAKPNAVPLPVNENKNTVSTTPPLVAVKKITGKPAAVTTQQKKMHAQNDAVAKNDPATIIEPETGIKYKSIDIDDTAIANAISFASLPVAKKKLRVVHVNEIETPALQFAASPGRIKSDIKITFGRSFSTNTNNTVSEYTGGIKIPLTN